MGELPAVAYNAPELVREGGSEDDTIVSYFGGEESVWTLKKSCDFSQEDRVRRDEN